MKKKESIRVLVMQESGYYVAQCLEYDIAAQAKTFEELKDIFVRTFVFHIIIASKRGEEPFINIGIAPKYYFDRYKKAKDRLDNPFKITYPSGFKGTKNRINPPKITEVALA